MCSLGMPRMSQHSNVWQACHILGLYGARCCQWSVIACCIGILLYQFYNTLLRGCLVTCECLYSDLLIIHTRMYVSLRSNRNLCKIATVLRTRTKVLDASEVTSKQHQSYNKRNSLYKITSIPSIFEASAIVPVSTNYIYPAYTKHQSTIQYLPSYTATHLASHQTAIQDTF